MTTRSRSDNAIAWFAGLILAALSLLSLGVSRNTLLPFGARVDLGDVSIGQTCEKAFVLSNHSSRAIVLVGWAPTCHCIQARFPDTIIRAKSSINAYVQTTAITPLGKRAAAIAIQWRFVNDSMIRTDRIVVCSRYVSPLLLSEDRLDFSHVPQANMAIKDLFVRRGNNSGGWNELEVRPTTDRLSVNVHPSPAGFQISTQLHPQGLPIGVWKSTLKVFPLQNGIRTGQEIDIPVEAQIEGAFSAFPPVLQFFDHRNRALSFVLRIHSSKDAIRDLHILGKVVQAPRVEISKDGKDASVSGSLESPISKGMFVGKIPLQINNGPEGSLEVSFIGYPG